MSKKLDRMNNATPAHEFKQRCAGTEREVRTYKGIPAHEKSKNGAAKRGYSTVSAADTTGIALTGIMQIAGRIGQWQQAQTGMKKQVIVERMAGKGQQCREAVALLYVALGSGHSVNIAWYH